MTHQPGVYVPLRALFLVTYEMGLPGFSSEVLKITIKPQNMGKICLYTKVLMSWYLVSFLF